MIKSVLLVIAGAAGALELDKRMEKVRSRFSPRAVTDSVLDKLNQQLEKNR
ncbi:MAG: hypothetical protein ACLGHL_00280 [Actinomycetota bacterium]